MDDRGECPHFYITEVSPTAYFTATLPHPRDPNIPGRVPHWQGRRESGGENIFQIQ